MVGEEEAYLGHDILQVAHRPQDKLSRKGGESFGNTTPGSQDSTGQEIQGGGDATVSNCRCRRLRSRLQ